MPLAFPFTQAAHICWWFWYYFQRCLWLKPKHPGMYLPDCSSNHVPIPVPPTYQALPDRCLSLLLHRQWILGLSTAPTKSTKPSQRGECLKAVLGNISLVCITLGYTRRKYHSVILIWWLLQEKIHPWKDFTHTVELIQLASVNILHRHTLSFVCNIQVSFVLSTQLPAHRFDQLSKRQNISLNQYYT